MRVKIPLWKIRELFILIVVVPLLFFLLLEGVFRVAGINTDIVKSDKFKVGIPLWAHNEANMAIAGDIYNQILANDLPPEAAEWMSYFSEARFLHYKMKKNVSARVSNTVNRMELERGIKVDFESNSDGFRTAEVSRKKGDNVFRIVFMGDSTTFGWGVNQDERFSSVLEKLLNESQDRIEFEAINLGIPGYSTIHGLQVFEHYALKYKPDMVVVSFGANDSRKVPPAVKKLLNQPAWIEGVKDFLGNFKVYRFFRKTLLSMVNPFDDETKQSADETSPREPMVTPGEYTRNLERIITVGRERGIQTVLLGLCCPIDYLAKMSAIGQRHDVVAVDGMNILLRHIPAIQAGTEYASLAARYRELYGKEVLESRRILYVTSDSCHPNIIGHQILARYLFDTIFLDKIR